MKTTSNVVVVRATRARADLALALALARALGEVLEHVARAVAQRAVAPAQLQQARAKPARVCTLKQRL